MISLHIDHPLPSPSACYDLHHFLSEVHPVGTVLSIKEPFVHFGPVSGQPEILVSTPTDIQEHWQDGGFKWSCNHSTITERFGASIMSVSRQSMPFSAFTESISEANTHRPMI